MNETIVVLKILHKHELPHLGEMIAGRAWTMNGVESCELVTEPAHINELRKAGFTLPEIALGQGEVVR